MLIKLTQKTKTWTWRIWSAFRGRQLFRDTRTAELWVVTVGTGYTMESGCWAMGLQSSLYILSSYLAASVTEDFTRGTAVPVSRARETAIKTRWLTLTKLWVEMWCTDRIIPVKYKNIYGRRQGYGHPSNICNNGFVKHGECCQPGGEEEFFISTSF